MLILYSIQLGLQNIATVNRLGVGIQNVILYFFRGMKMYVKGKWRYNNSASAHECGFGIIAFV